MSDHVPARPLPRPRTTRLGGLGLLAAALVLAGCAADPDPTGTAATTAQPSESTSPPATAGTASAPTSAGATADGAPTVQEVALSEALDHVHGLHVGPDGVLLAGTHTGVVAIDPAGAVTAVGPDRDDLMGMTGIPGTDTLVSSGHPGAGSDLPNPLGLIVSTDGGATWTPRALTGQVDFHALAGDGDTVAGFDGSQGLLVSTDAGTTFRRGASIAPAALAVTQAGIWATTADGLQRSTDGGLSFSVVAGAPLLVLLASGADGSLWGVDTAGVAWRSADGTTWDRRGEAGAVDALAVGPSGTAYALTTGSVIALT